MQSKGLSRVFSNTTVQKHQFFWRSAFFMVQLLHPYMTPGKSIALTIRTFVGKVEEERPDAIWSERTARIFRVLLGGPHGDQRRVLPTGQNHIPIQAGSTLPGSGRSRATAPSRALSCLPLLYSACRPRLTLPESSLLRCRPEKVFVCLDFFIF